MSDEPTPGTHGAPAGWDEIFARQQHLTRSMMERHEELVKLVHRLSEPGTVEPVQLTAANPVAESSAVPGTVSVGLLNPRTAVGNVALGVFGSATATDAIQVAPGGLLILPIRAGVVEVAAVGVLGAGVTAYAYILRFKSVQSAHYS